MGEDRDKISSACQLDSLYNLIIVYVIGAFNCTVDASIGISDKSVPLHRLNIRVVVAGVDLSTSMVWAGVKLLLFSVEHIIFENAK